MDRADPFALLGENGFLAEMARPYWRSIGLSTLTLVFSLTRRPPARRLAPLDQSVSPSIVRKGWDSTWFLPVFVWGIETSNRAIDSMHWGHWTKEPMMPWKFQAILASAATIATLVLSGLLAEGIGSCRGLQARAQGGSLPLPVTAAVAAPFGVWFLTIGLFVWSK
jgi:hypothetical protein